MSSSGIYTRYINKYPGWSDNNDTMYYPIYKDGAYLGHFHVENTAGNTWAYCQYFVPYYASSKRVWIYDYEGKKAIQNVLDYITNNKDAIIKKLFVMPVYFNPTLLQEVTA